MFRRRILHPPCATRKIPDGCRQRAAATETSDRKFVEVNLNNKDAKTQSFWNQNAPLTVNLVAVPHGGISPRTLSRMKVSADSRRRLDRKSTRLNSSHLGI